MNADNSLSLTAGAIQQWMIDSSTLGQQALTLAVFLTFIAIMVTTPSALRSSR
jgi:hypothetical protein